MLVEGSAAAEGVENIRNGLLIDENGDSMAATLLNVCRNRELMRQIGQRAADEIYVSWNDSVAKAVERYNVVIERYGSVSSW